MNKLPPKENARPHGLQVAAPRATAEELRARKLAERARLFGSPPAVDNSHEKRLLVTFHHGPCQYALPVDQVAEFQNLEGFTPMPHAPPYVAGVVHWRGFILALLDLNRLFGVSVSGIADVHASLIVHAGGCRVALAATAVDDMVAVDPHDIRPAPQWPVSRPASWTAGVLANHGLVLRMEQILPGLQQEQEPHDAS